MSTCRECGVSYDYHHETCSVLVQERIHDAERAVLKACAVAWEAKKAIPAGAVGAGSREHFQFLACLATMWDLVGRMVGEKR